MNLHLRPHVFREFGYNLYGYCGDIVEELLEDLSVGAFFRGRW